MSPRLGVGRVRSVVQHAEIERQLREIDVLADGIAGGFGRLVERVEIRARFHFDHRKALAVVEIKIAAILEKGASYRHGPLIVERRPVHQEGCHAVEAEAVVQPVGVFGVLLVDDIRDHNVADAAVERRGLAKHVDTSKRADAFRHLPQNVVGPEA